MIFSLILLFIYLFDIVDSDSFSDVNNFLKSSTCSKAIVDFTKYTSNNWNWSEIRKPLFSSEEINLLSNLTKTKLVNIAAGSTGTSEIFEVFCNDFHIKSIHGPYTCGHKSMKPDGIRFSKLYEYRNKKNKISS
jgi:hypothetical protein